MKNFFFKIGRLALLAIIFSILSRGVPSIEWDVIGAECSSNLNRPAPYDKYCWGPVTVYGYPEPYLYPDISSSATSEIEFRPFVYDTFFYFLLLYTVGGVFTEVKKLTIKNR